MPFDPDIFRDGTAPRYDPDVFGAPMPQQAGQAAAQPPAAVAAGKQINSIPRQFGLTARYGLEGLANTAQIVTEPIRYLMDAVTPDRTPTMSQLVTGQRTPKSMPLGAVASQFADWVGLPKPQSADERVIGDATRLMAGAGGLGVAAGAPVQIGRRVMQAMPETILAANMGGQVASAVGAGLAGGASREAGGSPLMQGAAAFGGGIMGGMTPSAVGSMVDAGKRIFNRMTPQQMDTQIEAVLGRAGYDYSQLPGRARQSLRAELEDALRAGQELDPVAVARFADFQRVGATPTRGMITQNPVQITREMNLAKTGANTNDEGLQGLAQLQNQNNATFIRNLNEQGAARGNMQAAGETVNSSILGRQTDLRNAEQAAWNAAKGSPGYTQPIEANVISRINQALGDEGMMPFLNPTISKYMEAFQTGQPFTPQAYRNLQSMLSNEMARGGNEAAAAGIARSALMQAELRPITNPRGIDFGNAVVTPDVAARLRAVDAQPGQAIDAVNQARRATRAAYEYEGSSPLVRSVLSDGASGDPMRIAQRFVIGGTPNEAQMLAKEIGDAGRGPIRDAIVAHLKERAIGKGVNDEVGKFSQSAYAKALSEIGDRKLGLFFAPEEITQLRALGRVSSLAMNQPVGSAVNNSNSGALMLGRTLDALRAGANAAPVLGPLVVTPIANGIQGLNVTMRTRQAQNLAPGLLAAQERRPFGQGLLLPGMAVGGLLAAP